MPFLLFPIITLGILLIHCVHLFFISERHRKHIVKNGSDSVELRHNQEHLAGVILMFFCGSLLESGLILIFIDRFIIDAPVSPSLFNYVSGMMGVYLIANIWYIVHLKKEESGFFGEHGKNSKTSE